MKRGWWVLKFVVLGAVMLLLVGLATQLLWNWLVPVLFSGPVVTFWQAIGLIVLSKIFFSGFGRGCHGGHWQGGRWRKHYWKEKWSGMTPQEREAFKEKMKERWCPPLHDSSDKVPPGTYGG